MLAERLGRRWVRVELIGEYIQGAFCRFQSNTGAERKVAQKNKSPENYYRIPHPGILWNNEPDEPLAADGGKKRPVTLKTAHETRLGKAVAGRQMALRIAAKAPGDPDET